MKAHIARNQNAGVPLILGWNLSWGSFCFLLLLFMVYYSVF